LQPKYSKNRVRIVAEVGVGHLPDRVSTFFPFQQYSSIENAGNVSFIFHFYFSFFAGTSKINPHKRALREWRRSEKKMRAFCGALFNY